jgi:hypothetical protein
MWLLGSVQINLFTAGIMALLHKLEYRAEMK